MIDPLSTFLAITPFEALCGFRPASEILSYFHEVKELLHVVGQQAVDDLINAEMASGMFLTVLILTTLYTSRLECVQITCHLYVQCRVLLTRNLKEESVQLPSYLKSYISCLRLQRDR